MVEDTSEAKPNGAVRPSWPRAGPVNRSHARTRPWPPPPPPAAFAAYGGRQEGESGVSRAPRGFAVHGGERHEVAAGGNAGGDLVGGGAERFSGLVAGRGSGGGVAGLLGRRRGLAPTASPPPPPKRKAVSSTRRFPPISAREPASPVVRRGGGDGLRLGASASQGGFGCEEGVLLPAVLEKVVAAKGGASVADRHPHGPEAMVGKTSHASVGNAAFSGAGGGFFGARSDQLGENHLETLAAQGQELEEGEIAEITQGMIKNDAVIERQEELEEADKMIAPTMEIMPFAGPVEARELEHEIAAKGHGQGPEDREIATESDHTVQQSHFSVDVIPRHSTRGIMRSNILQFTATKTDHTSQRSQISADLIPRGSTGGIVRRKTKFIDFPSTSATTVKKFKQAAQSRTVPVDLASESTFTSKEKHKFEPVFVSEEELKGKSVSFFEDDDILKAVAVHGGRLELCLNAPSRGRSLWCHGPHRGQKDDHRTRVGLMCRRFQFLCRFLAESVKQGSLKLSRVDRAVDNVIKNLPDYIHYGSFVGEVDGVEVGDKFIFRAELAIAGLHNTYRAGIDTTRDTDGELIAVSIIASGGYLDEYSSSSGELIYTGSGGKAAGTDQDGDQKLERGNLALKNCIKKEIPVRVTHGFKTPNRGEGSHSIGKENPNFIYDGLYHVVGFWQHGIPGSRVFKYKLRRIPGQPKLPLHVAKWLRKSVVRPR